MVLGFIDHRRPPEEHRELLDTVLAEHDDAEARREILQMGRTIASSLADKGRRLGRAEGRKLGKQEGLELGKQEGLELGLREGALRNAQEVLRDLLSERFGKLPKAIIQAIAQETDIEKIRSALRASTHWKSLAEFAL